MHIAEEQGRMPPGGHTWPVLYSPEQFSLASNSSVSLSREADKTNFPKLITEDGYLTPREIHNVQRTKTTISSVKYFPGNITAPRPAFAEKF